MTSPPIQKQLVNYCASDITQAILSDLGDRLFAVMVDESRDISIKGEMAVVIRYVNKHREIIERFLAFIHVSETLEVCLKEAINFLFAKHRSSSSRLRIQ